MNIVITAGGTSEHIDAVRTITNTGTGTLASMIVDTFMGFGNEEIDNIFYICTTKAKRPNSTDPRIKYIVTEDTNSVADAVKTVLTENQIDWFIHAMAISDYYVDRVVVPDNISSSIKNKLSVNGCSFEDLDQNQFEDAIVNCEPRLDNSKKLSSSYDNMLVVLKKTPKIIGMIKKLSPSTHLVGFKLLNNVSTQELIAVAENLMEKNDCDYVVANDSAKITADKHEAFIVSRNGKVIDSYTNESIALILTQIIFDEKRT